MGENVWKMTGLGEEDAMSVVKDKNGRKRNNIFLSMRFFLPEFWGEYSNYTFLIYLLLSIV